MSANPSAPTPTPEQIQAALTGALARLHHALPRTQPWFKTAMDFQFGLSIAATVLALVPLIILAIRRRGRIASLLMPFTIAVEPGVSRPFIVPVPIAICMQMVLVMSLGSLVSGRLLTDFFLDPLGTKGEGGLACLFIVWFLAAVGMELASFGCAISAILSPASRSSFRSFVKFHPLLINTLCLGFPAMYGTIGLVVSSLVQYRLDRARSAGRQLEAVLLSGLNGTNPLAIVQAQALNPGVTRALHDFERLNKIATYMNASMTLLMLTICTPCLVHIFILSRNAMRMTCVRIDGQITQIRRISMAVAAAGIPSNPSTPRSAQFKLSPPTSPTSPTFSKSLSGTPAPAEHLNLLARERRRVRLRHATVLAQWVIGLVCLFHLGAMATYLAAKYKSIAESNDTVVFSLVMASIFSPAYNALMSLMTIVRMLFLEEPNKSLVATTGSRTAIATVRSSEQDPVKEADDSSSDIVPGFVLVHPVPETIALTRRMSSSKDVRLSLPRFESSSEFDLSQPASDGPTTYIIRNQPTIQIHPSPSETTVGTFGK